MTNYPKMVWEMFATNADGERCYIGNCDYEEAADLLLNELSQRGYTEAEKVQRLRENAGQSLLKRPMQ